MKSKDAKRRHEIEHVRRRLKERFGITLNEQEIERLNQAIGKHPAWTFVERQSQRVTVWNGVMLGQEMYVVYDKLRNTVVSVITPEQWKNKDQGAY